MKAIAAAISAAVLLGSSSVALAQDHLADHAHVVRQGMLNRSLNGQRGASARSTGLSPGARATCLNKGQAAAKYGMGDAKVRRLYALCAQVGY